MIFLRECNVVSSVLVVPQIGIDCMKSWFCFAMSKEKLQKFRVLFDGSFGHKSVRINSGLGERKLLLRESTLHSLLIQVSAFKLQQRRKYLRQYVSLQIFYSLAQTYFYVIAISFNTQLFPLLILACLVISN